MHAYMYVCIYACLYVYICMYVYMYGHHLQQSTYRPGKVANITRGQLNMENEFPCSRLRIWCHETGSAVPSGVSLLILHTQAEYGAYSQDSFRFPRQTPFIFTANRHRVSPNFFYQVTQLRTDGVHCRESAGIRPVVALKAFPVTTGAAFAGFTVDQ